ncbi:MAG: ABC transporter permease [Gemmatimonadaceae bacterium]
MSLVVTATVDRPVVSQGAVLWALLRRDARVASRELPFFLVRTVMQPVLFLIVFGFLLPKMGFVRGGYTAALLPGIIAVSLTLSSVQSVALPMVQDFGFTREIEDRLLAPVPMQLIGIEKILSGALQGVIAALVILPIARLIMGPIPGLTLAGGGEALLVTLLGSLVFASLGLVMGTVISAQQIGLMFSVIIAPMLMFGCAYYPWMGLKAVPAFQYGVLVNPLVYVAEAMRATLTPELPHMPLLASVSAMIVLSAVFVTLGMRSFARRAQG